MAKLSEMRARVENWANWKRRQADGVGRYASVNMTDPTPVATDPYAQTPIHPNEEDAWAVETAMRAVIVASELRATIECHYFSTYTEVEKLRRLAVSKSTLYARLDRVDRLLVQYFGEKHARADRERTRVEALAAGVRPV